MATPCGLVKRGEDGTYLASSARSDGYLSGVGAMLFKFYQDPGKVDRLFAMGWVSPLEAEPEDHNEQTFDGEWPLKFADRREAVLTAALQGLVFLYEDGKWFDGAATDFDEKAFRYREAPTFQEITRERLLEEDARLEEFLDSTEKPPTFRQQLADMRASLLEQAKSNPNLEVLGDPAIGIVGVSVSIGGPRKQLLKDQSDRS